MANYIVPQVLISQLISEVQLNTIRNQNVLVIGPNYALFRYSEASEKAKCFIGTYNGADVLDESNESAATVTNLDTSLLPLDLDESHAVPGMIPYPQLPSASIPDASYTKLFADDVVFELAKWTGFHKLEDGTAGEKHDGRLRFDFALTGKYRGCNTEYTEEDGSNDVVASIKQGKDVVVELLRDIVPGDVIRIQYGTSSDGLPLVYTSIVNSVFESVLDSGVYDCVQLEDTLPSTTNQNGVVTYEINEDTSVVQVCAMVDAVEIPQKAVTPNDWNWTTYHDSNEDEYGIVVDGGMKIHYSNWGAAGIDREIISAKLYVEYRALLSTSASDIQSIASHALVENALGTVHPDNPLAFGTYLAALNSGDRLVYYCGVATDDLSGYNRVLDKASLSDEVYFIVPLSRNESVIDSVKAHVEEMSSKENKLWRVAFVSQEPPTEDVIYDASANVDNSPFYAKFIPRKTRTGVVYDLMQFMWDDNKEDTRANTVVKCLSQLEAGDFVKVYTRNTSDTWDDTPKYTEYQIKKVISNTVVQLTSDVVSGREDTSTELGDGVDAHYEVEVYRKLSHTRQAQYIADLSSSLATRRVYNVFPSVASTDGVAFTGEFIAAAAAGLASSVLPQQPITNVELNGIGDIPLVYQTFSRAELNTIAAGGTFIVMQDRPGAQVYVRHQISTAYPDNNLLKSELSITKNLDSISYYFAELFAPIIGKYNITPELIDMIRARLNQGLSELESATVAGMYGPQVLADGTDILELRQSEVNRDHIYAKVHLNLPVPFNYFDLDLEI